jgi:hypothetical protein
MSAREAVTIRVPGALLARAKLIKDAGESLNDFVVQAVDREVRRRQSQQAYIAILRQRDAIVATGGVQPDSGPLIRSLRDGDERHG